MLIPNLVRFTDSRAFLTELLDQNQAARPKFSYSSFARRVGWPRTYLSDLLAGRKSLTVSRAIQFARFARFDGFNGRLWLPACVFPPISDARPPYTNCDRPVIELSEAVNR